MSDSNYNPKKNDHLINLMGSCAPCKSFDPYIKLLFVLDYVAGMTDKFATGMYRQIQGITTGSMTPATIIK